MDPKQLKTLITIVDVESFTRASRKLGVSQSSISQHISGLEKQIGVQLLVRSGSGAKPTRAGQLLVQYARQILGKMDEAQRLLSELDGEGGSLRIGATGAACQYLLPEILKEFHRLHPRHELRLMSGNSVRSVQRLHAGEIDVGLVTLPLTDPKLQFVAVGFDELKAIVAPQHGWVQRSSVQGSDFSDERLLVYDRGSQTHTLIERFLLEHGIFPRVAVELDDLEGAVAVARVGLGVAIVPSWAVIADCTNGSVRALPIGKRGLTRSWSVALPAQTPQTQPLKAFVRLCKERLPAALSAAA